MPKILVVDDQPTARDFLVTLLGYAGYDVLEASDGAEGLGVARAGHPDLIITDVLMPTMDGYEFIRRLRSEPSVAATNVVFYSACYHDRESMALARKCGVAHIIRKPSAPEVVLQTVQAALGLETPPVMKPATDFDREHLRVVSDKLSEKVAALEGFSSRLEALIELSQESASIRDIRLLTDKYCQAARTLLGARYAAILLLDDRGAEVEHFSISGATAEVQEQIERPAFAGIFKRLADNTAAMKEKDFGSEWRSRLSAKHPLVHSFLGSSIRRQNQCHGVIYVANKVGADDFSDEEKTFLETLAAWLAIYCENVRLYDQLQERARQLEDKTLRLRSLSSRLMAAREDEQRHIGRELHDEIGQGLTAMKIHLQTVQRASGGTPFAPHIEESLKITELTLQQVRSLSLDLRPSVLDDLGLVPALRWLLDRQSAVGGFATQFAADPPAPDLSVEVRTACYRVVQEALTNIVRHANATSVSVRLLQNGNGLRVEVSDNGHGFSVFQARKRASAGGSLGVVGMEERASLAGGRLVIDSAPGAGTTLCLEFSEYRKVSA